MNIFTQFTNNIQDYNVGYKAIYYLIDKVLVLLTALLAAITIIVVNYRFLKINDSVFIETLAVLIVPILFLNFIALIFWLVKLKIWCLIPIIAIAFSYNYISCILNFTKDRSNVDDNNNCLKIASYNVHAFSQLDNNESLYQIASGLEQEKIDILAMQEFSVPNGITLDDVFKEFAFLPYRYIPKGETGNKSLAVFSKYPILNGKLTEFSATNNNFLWCDLSVNDKTIRLFNAHLQTTGYSQSSDYILLLKNSSLTDSATIDIAKTLTNRFLCNKKRRIAQATQLANIIDTTKTDALVCGDFNDIPLSDVYQIFSNRLNDGFKQAGNGYAYSYRVFMHTMRIDYIFNSKGLKSVSFYYPSWTYSDHNPAISIIKYDS